MRPDLAALRAWRMAGVGMAAPLAIRADRARGLVPAGVDPALIPVVGRVPAVLFVARYDSTSTLSYSELGFGILARPSATGRPGFFCTHLWVDSAESLEAGRSIWGLPKELARFDWQKNGSAWSVQVQDEAGPIATIGAPAPVAGLSIPMGVSCFSFHSSGRLLRWGVRSRSVINRVSLAVHIPAESRLSGLAGSRCQGVFMEPLHLSFLLPSQGVSAG